MNYKEFLQYKADLIKNNPSLLNLSDSNLYEYFNIFNISSTVGEGHSKGKVYRCHMVEDYLDAFGLPVSWKSQIGANQGVRQSLSVLFPLLRNWSIPKDVYPFYQEEIRKTQRNYFEYDTLHSEDIFAKVPDGTLLVTYPLKPKGKNYLDSDLKRLKNFLSRDPGNIIVVDMVYWLNFAYPAEILDLIKTNQVIILHSFSKVFLLPNCFGISIFPDSEQGTMLRDSYKTLAKDELKINKAFNAIRHYRIIPEVITEKLLLNNIKLRLRGFQMEVDSNNPGYLHFSEITPNEFLDRGIIVIPESVFGGTGNGSIISSLI